MLRKKCCFSHPAYWLPTRKTLLYTVPNLARRLLKTGKREQKRESLAVHPLSPLVRGSGEFDSCESQDLCFFSRSGKRENVSKIQPLLLTSCKSAELISR